MNELLAIAGPAMLDGALVEQIGRRRPDAVTLVVEDEDGRDRWVWDQSPGAARGVSASLDCSPPSMIAPAQRLSA